MYTPWSMIFIFDMTKIPRFTQFSSRTKTWSGMAVVVYLEDRENLEANVQMSRVPAPWRSNVTRRQCPISESNSDSWVFMYRQWPFQEKNYWRYLPYRRPMFHASFSGNIPRIHAKNLGHPHGNFHEGVPADMAQLGISGDMDPQR